MTANTPAKGLRQRYRAVIVGGGPAGLAAATGLTRAGISDFILIERASGTGGILNQCIHNGFGLKYYGEDLTGPEFARRMEAELYGLLDDCSNGSRPELLCSSMVSRIKRNAANSSATSGFELQIHSVYRGLLNIATECVIVTTGCRERTRENIEVPGTRPAGLFTAGQAQNLINLGHHRPGSRAVIQGSGDIGLIMARRLTLEGIEVVAVYERLPYLSGSIRNKVQCLDHFGIPLYLGRQISDIRGRSRVSAVETAALDSRFEALEGTEQEVECDTVLFAAGLIPELETVKPAGVNLPDGFHPEAGACFETNIPGIFTAGNCLHINDLADTAAEEGRKAAGSAIKYLTAPEVFRTEAHKTKGTQPYTDAEPQTGFNEAFFKQLKNENLTVCITCPRGCLLKKDDYGCSRGEEYFKRLHSADSGSGFRQRIHTSVELKTEQGKKLNFSAVSDEEVPAAESREIIEELKKLSESAETSTRSLIVDHGGSSYSFRLCPQESSS